MPTEIEDRNDKLNSSEFVNSFAKKLILDLVDLVVDSVHESRLEMFGL